MLRADSFNFCFIVLLGEEPEKFALYFLIVTILKSWARRALQQTCLLAQDVGGRTSWPPAALSKGVSDLNNFYEAARQQLVSRVLSVNTQCVIFL